MVWFWSEDHVVLKTTYDFCFRGHTKVEVGGIEKRVDLAWKSERVQLPGPFPSVTAMLQPASKAHPRVYLSLLYKLLLTKEGWAVFSLLGCSVVVFRRCVRPELAHAWGRGAAHSMCRSRDWHSIRYSSWLWLVVLIRVRWILANGLRGSRWSKEWVKNNSKSSMTLLLVLPNLVRKRLRRKDRSTNRVTH